MLRPENEIHILLVEDDEAQACLFKYLLADIDGNVHLHVEPDGDGAVEFLLSRARPDSRPQMSAVLLDIHLPRKDGVEILLDIRTHDRLTMVPVYLFTGAKNVAKLTEGHEDKYHSIIQKPSGLDGFTEMILRLLESLSDYIPRRYCPPTS